MFIGQILHTGFATFLDVESAQILRQRSDVTFSRIADLKSAAEKKKSGIVLTQMLHQCHCDVEDSLWVTGKGVQGY